jgi:hypothetical protein
MTPRTKHRFAAITALSVALLVPVVSHADLVVPPPPECVDRPDGTQCILDNGTAGVCTHRQDSRRPGRSYVVCEADAHECDRLAVGAECHGYLRRPSHCREFTNDRNEHWRACMNDDTASSAPPPASASTPPAGADAANAPASNDHRVVAPQTSPASTGRRCSASPAIPDESQIVTTLAVLFAAAVAFTRRKKRALARA